MNNETWAPIRYRDFYDVPRIFLANYRGRLYLFDCPFDEETEDFPDFYHVYTMPPIPDEDELTAMTPEDAAEHLKKAASRIQQERRAYRQRPVAAAAASVPDW